MSYGVNWTATFDTQPAATDNIGNGHAEIVALKQGTRERVARDHEFDLANAGTVANQGVHKKGSARSFLQANAPTEGEQGNLASDVSNIYDGKLWTQANSRIPFVQTYGNGGVAGWQPLTVQPRVHEWSSFPAVPTSMQLAGFSYHELTTLAGVAMSVDLATNPPPLDGAVAIIDNRSDQPANITIISGTVEVVAAHTSGIFVYNSNQWSRVTGLAATQVSGYAVDPDTAANTIPVRANGTSNAGKLPGDIEGNANGAFWLVGQANSANVPAGSYAAIANPGAACANCVAIYGAAFLANGKAALHCDVNGSAYTAMGMQPAGSTTRYPAALAADANSAPLRDADGAIAANLDGGVKIGATNTYHKFGEGGAPTYKLLQNSSWTPPSAGVWYLWMFQGELDVSFAGSHVFDIINNQTGLCFSSNGNSDWVFTDQVFGDTHIYYWKL